MSLFTCVRSFAQAHHRTELAKILQTKAKEFADYYVPNKIYIPKGTADKIRQFSKSLMSLASTFAVGQSMQKAQLRNVQSLDANGRKFLTLVETVPQLLSSLEDDFQSILGFPVDTKAAAKLTSLAMLAE